MAIHEREIPPNAFTAKEATEVFRAWIIDQRFVCSLLPGAFEDPAGWGILLADAARHIANALAESRGVSRDEALKRIQSVFDAEVARPTAVHSGRFVGVRPLSDDEQRIADEAAEFITASMGTGGRSALQRLPVLWYAVASFGMGVVRSLARPAKLEAVRVVAVALDAYVQIGMSAADASQFATHVVEQGETPPIKAMTGEGERAVAEWLAAGDEPPTLLEAYLAQMEQMAAG